MMTVNKIRDPVFENYYKRIGFSYKNSFYSMKDLKKISKIAYVTEKKTDPPNAKKYYQSS